MIEMRPSLVLYRDHLKARLRDCQVPEHLHSGLIEYVSMRRPTGGFLNAVLTNDLREAALRADWNNQLRIFDIVRFLNNHVPGSAWGSVAAVDAWLADPDSVPEIFE